MTFKEQLRTLGFFSKCTEGVNRYVLASTASLNQMIPLAIAFTTANHLIAAGICYSQCTATTLLFVLDRALGCFGDLKKYATNPTIVPCSAYQVSTCKLERENVESGSEHHMSQVGTCGYLTDNGTRYSFSVLNAAFHGVVRFTLLPSTP